MTNKQFTQISDCYRPLDVTACHTSERNQEGGTTASLRHLANPRLLVLADTPNLYRRSAATGEGIRPDYDLLRRQLLKVGSVRAEAVVNGGVSNAFVGRLRAISWLVTFSHADDTDEMLIARAVLRHRSYECVVIASGDGKNIELVTLLRAAGKYTVVAGIPGSIHKGLYRVADLVVDVPVRLESATLNADLESRIVMSKRYEHGTGSPTRGTGGRAAVSTTALPRSLTVRPKGL